MAQERMGVALVLLVALGACGHEVRHKATAVMPQGRALVSSPVLPLGQLRDQDGRPFESRDLRGHVWITALMFTSCTMACPVMAERMHYLQTLLPLHSPALRLLSVTLDPEVDTSQVLSAYGKRFHQDRGLWTFLTGETEPLLDVVTAAYRSDADGGRGASFDHGETLVLIDGEGAVRGYYRKDDAAVKQLFADADRLAAL